MNIRKAMAGIAIGIVAVVGVASLALAVLFLLLLGSGFGEWG